MSDFEPECSKLKIVARWLLGKCCMWWRWRCTPKGENETYTCCAATLDGFVVTSNGKLIVCVFYWS